MTKRKILKTFSLLIYAVALFSAYTPSQAAGYQAKCPSKLKH